MDNSASLPDELWLAVLHAGIDNLGWECPDVCSLGLVSRRLNGLTNSNDLWAKLWRKEWPADVKKEDPGCWKRVFRFRYEREATQRKMAHTRKVLRLQSKASLLRKEARQDERALQNEHSRIGATHKEIKDLERQRQASTAVQVWQPVAVHDRLSALVEQQPVPLAAQLEALRHEVAVCELRIAQLRRSKKRKLEEAGEIDSRVAHLTYDPVTALAEERQARRKDAACKPISRSPPKEPGLKAQTSSVNGHLPKEGGEAKAEQSVLDDCKEVGRTRVERDSSIVHRDGSTSYCSGGSVDQKVTGDGGNVLLSEGESRERPRRRGLAHVDWSKVGMRPASPQLSTINSKQRI